MHSGGARLATGSMDGSVNLLDADNGDILHTARPHTKYCVRVLWCAYMEAQNSTQRCALLSGAWDASVALQRRAIPCANVDMHGKFLGD